MPSIVIYNTDVLEGPVDSEDYLSSYVILAKLLEQGGATVHIAQGIDDFLGNGTFRKGWTFRNGAFEKTNDALHADLVFNKGSDFHGDAGTRTLNDPALQDLCEKDATYALFPDVSPKSIAVHAKEDMAAAMESLHTALVVSKPINSYGGKNIHIGTKEDVMQKTDGFPTLLQEFVDTSKGIPGLTDGLHDLRLMYVAGTLADCYLRAPAPGKMTANVMQGGSIRQIPIADIPEGAKQLAARIDQELARFPDRAYCADVGLHDGREWKLFELNAPPGMPTVSDNGDPVPFLTLLAEHLLRFANASSKR